jgi:hypothetical protein
VKTSTSKASRHEFFMICLQLSSSRSLEIFNTLVKPCAPYVPPYLHDHSLNTSVLKCAHAIYDSTPSSKIPNAPQRERLLQARNQTPCVDYINKSPRLQGRVPYKHSYKVYQSMIKSTLLCFSIMEQPTIIHRPCTQHYMKHPKT